MVTTVFSFLYKKLIFLDLDFELEVFLIEVRVTDESKGAQKSVSGVDL